MPRVAAPCRTRRTSVVLVQPGQVWAAAVTWSAAGARVDAVSRVQLDTGGEDDPAGLARAVAQALASSGLGPTLDVLGLDLPLGGCLLTELPSLAGPPLRALVTRQVRNQLPGQRQDVLAGQAWMEPPDGTPSGDDPPAGRRACLAWIPAAALRERLQALAAEGLTVERVLPTSVAVLELGAAQLADQQDYAVVLHAVPPGLVIGVWAEGALRYARFLRDRLDGPAEARVSTILDELRSTTAFVREQHRGRAPERLLLSGLDDEDRQRLGGRVADELGWTVDPLEQAVLGAEQGDPAARLAALACHHRRRRPRGEAGLDLTPHRAPRDRWLHGALALALAGGLALSGSARQEVAAAGDAARGGLQGMELEAGRQDRQAGDRQLALLRQRELESLAAAGRWLHGDRSQGLLPVLEGLVALPEGLELLGAHLDRPLTGGGLLRLELGGDFVADGGQALQAYVDLLAGRPWCASVAMELEPGGRSGRDARPEQERATLELRLP